MTLPTLVWPILGLSLATALLAGVFLTFSDFLMRSLRRSAPAGGTEAMQRINREVYRSVFMVLFLGMVPISALALGYALLAASEPVATALTCAALLYLLGVFAVTAAGNVPMNQRLDAMPLAGDAAQAYWPAYATGWLRWNHLRSLAALAASASYAVASLLIAAAG